MTYEEIKKLEFTKTHQEYSSLKPALYASRKAREYRDLLFERLGAKCVHCGYDEHRRALQFDHINGGGSQIRARIRNYRYYKMLLEDPELESVIQVLCANCNTIKVYAEREHRVQYEPSDN